MYAIVKPLDNSWRDRGFGIEVEHGTVITVLVWADNLYFFAHCIKHVETMMAELEEAFSASKLAWKSDSLKFLCNSHVVDAVPLFNLGSGLCCVKEELMECLGVMFDAVGSTAVSVNHRLE